MNKIGLTNFRRFNLLKPIEYKGITFLVGRNNSGKSTLVKALLLINDFFKSGDIFTFSFVNKVLEDANIVTYGRAKNKYATHNFIAFEFHDDDFIVEIVLSGDEDNVFAHVENLLIVDTSKNLNFHFSPTTKTVNIFKGDVFNFKEDEKKNVEILNNEINRIKEKIASSKLKKSSKEYITLIEELSTVEEKKNIYKKKSKPGKEEYQYNLEYDYTKNSTMKEIVNSAVQHAELFHDLEFPRIQQGEKPSKQFADYRGVKQDARIIEDSFSFFYDSVVDYSSVIYLGANSTKQSALFPIRDKNNALAQSIHEFYQLKILPGEPAYEFVEMWMKIFEVGEGFEIEIHAGEAYEVKILSHNKKIHLADKGMGSIQAMLLILRLAVIIHKLNIPDEAVTVIIEEPELNLHPALQSKLADLFLECKEKYLLNFIIETHSEYILRRSQVLVAEKEFEVAPNENPFCVYYFPKDIQQQPYRLDYNEDGSFKNNFGDGFFDEASSSTLELLKLKRQKKA